MSILGISAGFHDAGLTLLSDDGDIIFAGHSERFSKIKNDPNIDLSMLEYALNLSDESNYPHTVAYYEQPFKKAMRQLRSGEKISSFTLNGELKKHIPKPILKQIKKKVSFPHHMSHAAAGFQTSPFDNATIVVIDAIGETDTISIWHAEYGLHNHANYRLLYRVSYPDSIGLFYSAMTQSIGLKPLEEEYILMGMAGYGKPHYAKMVIEDQYIESYSPPIFKENMHLGVDSLIGAGLTKFDIAAATQMITEQMIREVIAHARKIGFSSNLVYGGGVALNCVANRHLGDYFDNVWIMPCPGDAGSSLGAAALAFKKPIYWKDAFLGYNIDGEYPVKPAVDALIKDGIIGIANGKAEFGPRALGNRSLLADPRLTSRDIVNTIKQREEFRPFAPVVLAEHAHEYFMMPNGFRLSPYMQVTATCIKPDEIFSVVHVDKTSRVQTVVDDGSGLRKVLEAWYKETGCPVLLNTSLNVKGQPLVNDLVDAHNFTEITGIPVLTNV